MHGLVPCVGTAAPQAMIARQLQQTFEFALNEALKRRHEYVTIEHLLFALLKKQLDDFLNKTIEKMPDDVEVQPVLTAMLQRVVQYAQLHAQSSGQKEVDTSQMLAALYQAERSQAVYLLRSQGVNKLDVLTYLSHGIGRDDEPRHAPAFSQGDDEAPPSSSDPLKNFAVNLIER